MCMDLKNTQGDRDTRRAGTPKQSMRIREETSSALKERESVDILFPCSRTYLLGCLLACFADDGPKPVDPLNSRSSPDPPPSIVRPSIRFPRHRITIHTHTDSSRCWLVVVGEMPYVSTYLGMMALFCSRLDAVPCGIVGSKWMSVGVCFFRIADDG